MIDPQVFSRALISCISLAGIALMAFFLISDYRLDAYRHRLFVLRERLIELALTHDVSLDQPAYRFMQVRIDSLLTYAHKTKLTMFVVYKLTTLFFGKIEQEAADQPDQQLRCALKGLSPDARRKMVNLSNDVDSALIHHLLFVETKISSPLSDEPALSRNKSSAAGVRILPTKKMLQVLEALAVRSYRLSHSAAI